MAKPGKDTALFKTIKTELKETNLETVQIEKITDCQSYFSEEATKFDSILKSVVLYAINHHQRENEPKLTSWMNDIFHSKLWLYFQTDIKSRLEVTLSTKTAEMARSINQAGFQSILDDGNLAPKIEFYPNTVKQAVPMGGSILSVLTKDHRLYLYRYRDAHPNFWSEFFDLSKVFRRHIIIEFFVNAQQDDLNLEKPGKDLGEAVFSTLKNMAIIDFIFLCCDCVYIEAVLLTVSGKMALISFSLAKSEELEISWLDLNSTQFYRLHRLDETNTILIVEKSGKIDSVTVEGKNLTRGSKLIVREAGEAVNDLHSIRKNQSVYLFIARQTVLQKLTFSVEETMDDTAIGIVEPDSSRRFETDCQPFIRLRSFLNQDAVQERVFL